MDCLVNDAVQVMRYVLVAQEAYALSNGLQAMAFAEAADCSDWYHQAAHIHQVRRTP